MCILYNNYNIHQQLILINLERLNAIYKIIVTTGVCLLVIKRFLHGQIT